MKVWLLEMGFTFKQAVYDFSFEKESFTHMTAARKIRHREMLIPIRNAASGRNEESSNH
jgi:hypothetical protein